MQNKQTFTAESLVISKTRVKLAEMERAHFHKFNFSYAAVWEKQSNAQETILRAERMGKWSDKKDVLVNESARLEAAAFE
jgi:hypothetical protein